MCNKMTHFYKIIQSIQQYMQLIMLKIPVLVLNWRINLIPLLVMGLAKVLINIKRIQQSRPLEYFQINENLVKEVL
jgi:hypothetical protein